MHTRQPRFDYEGPATAAAADVFTQLLIDIKAAVCVGSDIKKCGFVISADSEPPQWSDYYRLNVRALTCPLPPAFCPLPPALCLVPCALCLLPSRGRKELVAEPFSCALWYVCLLDSVDNVPSS